MAREYYSIPEAAARLGLSRIAVFKKVKKGQLDALRVGRNWAVPSAALEKAAALKNASAAVTGSPPTVRRGQALAAAPPRSDVKTPKKLPPPPPPDSEMDSMGWD